MQYTLLVVSADQALVREIVAHFEENDLFQVSVVSSDQEALVQASDKKFNVVILDGEGRTSPLSAFINDLSEIQPDAKVFLFPPDNNALHPDLEEITISAILQRPFSPRELDAFLEIVLGIGSVISTINEISEVKDADEDTGDEDSEFEDGESYLGETELRNLDELLESMPSPDPEGAPESEPENEPDQNQPAEPPLPEKAGEQEVESVWIRQDVNSLPDILSSDDSGFAEESDETQSRKMPQTEPPPEESIAPQSESAAEQQSAPEAEPVEETLEPAATEQPVIESIVEISSVSAPGTSPLGVKSVRFEYFCVLIPDNPNQFLARDLSDRLGFILPQIHISKGWRVTSLAVRPLFLMWQISLPADTCPADAVDEIRRRTTSHFFTNFPHLLTGNTGNDFWAPGYLILSGARAPSNSLISEFIQRTRLAQQKTNG